MNDELRRVQERVESLVCLEDLPKKLKDVHDSALAYHISLNQKNQELEKRIKELDAVVAKLMSTASGAERIIREKINAVESECSRTLGAINGRATNLINALADKIKAKMSMLDRAFPVAEPAPAIPAAPSRPKRKRKK